jgi:hypothetical protein
MPSTEVVAVTCILRRSASVGHAGMRMPRSEVRGTISLEYCIYRAFRAS